MTDESSIRPSPAEVEETTRRWVVDVVVKLGLCPFAAGVVKSDRVRYAVSDATTGGEALHFALQEASALLMTAPQAVSTTLIVFPYALDNFHAFLDTVAEFEGALNAVGAEGLIQVPSFHPEFCFEGADPDDPGNGTNRAPYPTMQLLREEEVTEAVDKHPNPASIPLRNIALLRKLAGVGLVLVTGLSAFGCTSNTARGWDEVGATPTQAGPRIAASVSSAMSCLRIHR